MIQNQEFKTTAKQLRKDNEKLMFSCESSYANIENMIDVLQFSEDSRTELSEKLRFSSSEFDLKCNELLSQTQNITCLKNTMNIIFRNLKRLSEAFGQVANAKFLEDKLNLQLDLLKKQNKEIAEENAKS